MNTYNFTSKPDTTYYYNATVCDYAGNCNNSQTSMIILDTTAPAITVVSSDPSTTLAVITWTTDESSNSSVAWGTSTALAETTVVNSTNVLSHSINLTGLAVGATYYYNVTSCDSYGNCNTSGLHNFTTDLIPSVSSSGSGGSPIFSVSDNQLTQGYSNVLYKNWQMKFSINNVSHSLKLDSKTNTTAIVAVSSTPQTKVLAVGEEWKVNINGDNYYDLLVKLNGLTLMGANITVTKINELISSSSSISNQSDSSSVVTSDDKEITGSVIWSLTNIILGAVILVVVTGLIFYLVKRKGR